MLELHSFLILFVHKWTFFNFTSNILSSYFSELKVIEKIWNIFSPFFLVHNLPPLPSHTPLQIRRALLVGDVVATGLPWMLLFAVCTLFIGFGTFLLAVAQVRAAPSSSWPWRR